MNLNVENFKNVLKKATLNHLIESIQLKIDGNTVKSRMISQSNDCITILNLPNDIITDVASHDEFEFNFLEPNRTVIPYLNLIEEGQTTVVKVSEEKISLVTGSQKSNLFFCSPKVVNIFAKGEPKSDISYFTKLNIDEQFISNFNKIMKIAPMFKKVYFNVENGVLSIETTDKTNNFSNGVKLDLDRVEHTDLMLCIDFRNISSVMSVLEGDFVAHFAYVKEQDMGLIFFEKNDSSERYYLMSRKDT